LISLVSERSPAPGGQATIPPAVLLGAGVLAVVGFAWTMLTGGYDLFAAELLAAVLVLLTMPIATRAARAEQSAVVGWLVMAAMVARLGGAIVRYAVAYGFYGGVADASTYTTVATSDYHRFRGLHLWWPNTGVFHGLVPWLDTIVYALAGPTELGSFFFFAWINFLGTYFFYRAFRIGYPEGDGRRYAWIVFFLPSLLYWPSSLGKESWMILAIGLACYGVARVLAHRVGGYVCLLLGIGGMLLVRPHLALIFLPAAFLAVLFRRSVPGRRRPLGRIIGVVVLIVASLAVVAKAQSYFGINSLDVQTVTQTLNTTKVQTAEGASTFHPPNAQSPIGYPIAVITVLFRPFPFEAHGLTVVVASLEGLIMLGLTAFSWRRLARLPSSVWRNPYLLFCLTYTALFVLAFANFSNFGILARERVQMLPVYMALLCMPKGLVRPARSRASSPARPGVRPLRRYGSDQPYPARVT
jgi:hypothetical protein